jgi:large subunit ribosomal protein L31e
MGHGKNKRKSANQPKKGALDTNQNKSLEETETTKETAEAEETTEPEEAEEEQSVAEESTEEEAIEEEKPTEEKAETEAEESEEVIQKKEKREEEIVEERIYTIPLSQAWISPRKKRVPRAVRLVKRFIQRHMKLKESADDEEQERLVISNEVNQRLWSRGIEKPPRNIRVRAVKDKEGTVTLYLAEGD